MADSATWLLQHRPQHVVGGQGLRRGPAVGPSRRAEDHPRRIEVVVEAAITRAAQALVLDALAVPLLLRPILRNSGSVFRDVGGVRHVDRADVRAWLIKATPNDLGHLPVIAAGVATGPVPDPMPVPERRRRIWL